MSQKSNWTSSILQLIVMIAILFIFNKYACSREEVTEPDVRISNTVPKPTPVGFKVLASERNHIIDTLCVKVSFTKPVITKYVNDMIDHKEQQLDSLVKNNVLSLQEASVEMNLYIRKLMFDI